MNDRPRLPVEWGRQAIQDLRGLDPQIRDRVLSAVRQFAETGEGDLVSMSRRAKLYRLRVGDWRVILQRHAELFIVRRESHRREAYRR